LLQLVGKKAAPIEDRRLGAAVTKKAPEAPHTPSSAQASGQAESPPSIAQSRAAMPLSSSPDAIPAPTQRREAPHVAELPVKIPSPYAALPVQRIPEAPPESEAIDRDGDDLFASEARRTLRQIVPRVAAQAQSEIARVLWVAANASDPTQDRAVVEAAQSISVGDGSNFSPGIAPAEARRLNDQALDAYWSRRNMTEAFDLQMKAFGANPYDAEIAGNLALLHLKPSRLQPETARQLALVALAYRGARSRAGRSEDWTTYAIASALTGRAADARNALFVTVALSRNIERSCKTAMGALSNYGERLREPVEAMLNRIHMQGRGYESPYCSLPPKWAMGTRLQ
jgi:hypothetical protein